VANVATRFGRIRSDSRRVNRDRSFHFVCDDDQRALDDERRAITHGRVVHCVRLKLKRKQVQWRTALCSFVDQ